MELNEVLNICNRFISSPDDKETQESYNNMLQSIVVRTYLTMQEKVIALVRTVIDSDKDLDVPESMFMAGLEISSCFNGLLAYTNIEQKEVDLSIKSYENYDTIYQSGLADYILQYCENDYNRLVQMLDRTLAYQNLLELISSIKDIDGDAIRDMLVGLKQMKSEMDPEILKNAADILKLNDPNLLHLKETIEADSVEKAMSKPDDNQPTQNK